MSRIIRAVCILAILVALAPVGRSQAAVSLPSNCITETQPNKEIYVSCMPTVNWNGELVVFAHGYVWDYPKTDPILPVDQMGTPDGKYTLPFLLNFLGYGFAATSYEKNGLAVQQGVENVRGLVSYVRAKYPATPIKRVYLVGASEGSLVATLALERYPAEFDGGLAICGPLGDFQKQVDYWGDFRSVFDYLYPALLPGDTVMVPDALMADWVSATPVENYRQQVINALAADPGKAAQLLAITGAPIDSATPDLATATTQATVLGILDYNILATNEASQVLGGNPFDNDPRQYSGSSDDTALNAGIKRFNAAPAALDAMPAYQTSGLLADPLMAMHTSGDPIVPVWHLDLYTQKVAQAHGPAPYQGVPVQRYGHCAFNSAELIYGFFWMVWKSAWRPASPVVIDFLVPAEEKAEFNQLQSLYGDVTQLQLYLPTIVR